jgi:hypothetical protein
MSNSMDNFANNFPWIIWKKCDMVFLDNVKKGFCLLAAFQQFLHIYQNDGETTDRITDADIYANIELCMSSVIEFYQEDINSQIEDTGLSPESTNTIIRWKEENLYTDIQSRGITLTSCVANFEILEYVIRKLNIDVDLFYLKQVTVIVC